MAARGAASERLKAMGATSGFGSVGLAQGLAALGTAIRVGRPSVLGVVPLVWSRVLGGGRTVPSFLAAFAPAQATTAKALATEARLPSPPSCMKRCSSW